MSAEQRKATYSTAPAPEIPRASCGRCEDWTTIVVGNVELPCPVCRADDNAARMIAIGLGPSA